jgi:hypothetical protein
MADKFTKFLSGLADGFLQEATNPKGNMGNWQHATRLFLPNSYRLTPRTKFLFYAQFEIDTQAVKSQTFINKHSSEVGYLIKSADLPKFTVDSVTKNQYNRKKIIYKNITYDPLNLTFHDDSHGIMNALWAIYFGYYSADRSLPSAAFGETKYRPANDPRSNFRYGLDNNKSVDIFKSITLYTMSRRRYLSYKLINPRIKSWSHGDMSYDANEFNTNTMILEYESIVYDQGSVAFNSPSGFAASPGVYDQTPSPLSVAGGGVATLFGDGGVLDGVEQIFGAVADGSAFGSVGGFLGTAVKAFNTVKNAGKLNVKNEIGGILSNPSQVSGIIKGVGGLLGTSFPRSADTGSVTTAIAKKFF